MPAVYDSSLIDSLTRANQVLPDTVPEVLPASHPGNPFAVVLLAWVLLSVLVVAIYAIVMSLRRKS